MGYINKAKSFQQFIKHMEQDKITSAVIEDLAARAKRGLEKYNTTLGENNH